METNDPQQPSAQFCMICLDVHRKLYAASMCELDSKFKTLTGISLEGELNFSPMFCSECAQRLVNCCKFRDKSLRAFQLLSELVQNNTVLSPQTLSSVDRARCQLTSSLAKKTFEPDHCDLYLTENSRKINKTFKSEKEDSIRLEFEDVSVSDIKCEFDFVQNDTNDSSNSVDVIDIELPSNESDARAIDKTNTNINVKNKEQILNCEIEKKEIISELKCLGDYDYDFDDDTNETEIIQENDKTHVKDNDKSNGRDNEVQCLDDDIEIDVDIDNDTKDSKKYIHVKFLNNLISKGNHNYYKNENINNRILKRVKSERVNLVSLKKITRTVKQYERVYNNKKVRRNTGLDKPKGGVKLKNAIKDRTAAVKSKRVYVKKTDSEGNVVAKGVKRKRRPKKEKKQKAPVEYEELKAFEVTERSLEEQIADWMVRQQSDSYQRARYKCTTCYKAFSDMELYNSHMDRHTEKFGVLTCPVCQIHVKRRGRLTSHVDNNHRYRYTCSACPFVTTDKGSAIRHTQWHNGIKYKCPHCDKEFEKYTSRLSHMRIKHPSSEHVCALCGFSFVSEKGLMFHTSKKHYCDDKQKLSGPRCEECGVRFGNRAAYETHVSVSPKHAGPGLIQANEAGRKKIRKKERNEDSAKEIECEVCGLELDSGRSYRFHLMASHPQHNRTKFSRAVLMCDQCGKVCNSKHIFKEHLLTHSGEKPLECSVCGKRFRHSASFKVHVERHSATAPSYQCAHCAYETKDKGNLTRHTQTHLDPNARKLHYCSECGKTFTTSAAMKNHMLHVHHKVPWPKRERPSGPRVQAPETEYADYKLE